jgi:hypothetical protein
VDFLGGECYGRHIVKRIAGALAVAAMLAIVTPVAFGSYGHTASKCGGKISVLVWPKGHGVIPSVNFPAIVNPHVEVYVGWNQGYPEALYGGYVVGGVPHGGIPVGDVNVRLNCINYGDSAKATATVPGGVRVTAKTALKCTLVGSGVFDLIERGHGSRVLVLHNGAKVLLRADVSPRTASVVVPKGACAKAPVPR